VAKTSIGIRAVPIAALLLLASVGRGETVSYTANLHTSKGNPVTDILILETDGTQVHATIYLSDLPGQGTSTISHDAPFAPTKSLIIGLTEGKDVDGNDKTQIIMFLDSGFAAANVSVPFSSVFSGARHSETIANLLAAVAGDATQLAWFTDTFFPGPAAGAAFATHGPFTVAEFTALTIGGISATAGNWVVNFMMTIPWVDSTHLATEVIRETAKTDTGPFDITLPLTRIPGELVIDKTVLNNTGVAWQGFEMRLGTPDSGGSFVPATAGDGLSFVATLTNHETTGAFSKVVVEGDRIVFTGLLGIGGTAHFVVTVRTEAMSMDEQTIVLRQIAVAPKATAPALRPWSLALLVALLGGFAAFRLRRLKLAGGAL
jgi:hypothetical protein